MTREEILNIISKGETETVEFKQTFNKTVIETLVAFSNTRGGKVLIGIKNDKSIVGVSLTEETIQKWINEIKQNTEPAIIPDVDIFKPDNKTVVVLNIKEFPIKPIACKGRFYIRKQNSNHQLSAQEISDIYMYSIQYSWDSYLFGEATLKDIDTKLVNNFITKVNNVKRFNLPVNPLDALNKLKFVKKGLPINGAIILFSKDILKYNVQCTHRKI